MINFRIYRSKPKNEKLRRTIRFAVLLIFILAALLTAAKERLSKIEPTGEYGKIKSNVEIDNRNASSCDPASTSAAHIDLNDIPEYEGRPTYVINGNKPEFTDEELERAREPFIELSELDFLGRCGTNTASLGKEMLDEAGERRDISGHTPSGWKQKAYPDIIDTEGGYLYHRTHLIAHMFAGKDPEIDGPKNLITATEYCNEYGMLVYNERSVQGWLLKKADGGRVLYRVTPIFSGSELVCRGVHIEAADIPKGFTNPDECGQQFHINVYCYNVEPGIEIDYMTGNSRAKD